MSSRPDTTGAAPEGRTAVLAFVAAVNAFKEREKHRQHFDDLGLGIHPQSVYRARRRREVGGSEAPEDPDQRDWIWKTVEVDAQKLGLDRIVAWLPRPSSPGRRNGQSAMLEALRSTSGVIRIVECFDDTFFVEAMTTDPLAKRRLHSRLREICPEVLWSEARQVDKNQPGRGWGEIAKEVASKEGNLSDSPVAP